MVLKGLGWVGFGALLLAAMLIWQPSAAWAGDPIGRLSLGIRSGLNGLDLGDINDGIGRSNARLRGAEGTADWELPERIRFGFNVGGDIHFDLLPSIRVGLIYGTTWGSTSVDFLQKISVQPRTKLLFPRAMYRIPYRPTDDMSLRAFAGPVFLLDSVTKISHENTSEGSPRLDGLTVKGSGRGFAAGLAGEYTIADRFSLAFELGWRQAKASFDSGEWTITKLRDPGSNDDEAGCTGPEADRLPNNRDLPEESFLWGFLNERYRQCMAVEPTCRVLEQDFSGLQGQIGLRFYLF
ncbi:MAG: porin family protein [Candidatus Eisenbacteria bacterium]|nr:porin family protein [Candidatus Eisenbacteria bacterium]